VRELREALKSLSPKNIAESFHDGQQHLEEAFTLFKLGYLGLDDKAKVENLYWKLCLEIGKHLPRRSSFPKTFSRCEVAVRPVSLQLLAVPVAAGLVGIASCSRSCPCTA